MYILEDPDVPSSAPSSSLSSVLLAFLLKVPSMALASAAGRLRNNSRGSTLGSTAFSTPVVSWSRRSRAWKRASSNVEATDTSEPSDSVAETARPAAKGLADTALAPAPVPAREEAGETPVAARSSLRRSLSCAATRSSMSWMACARRFGSHSSCSVCHVCSFASSTIPPSNPIPVTPEASQTAGEELLLQIASGFPSRS
mmetsp:Transcript_100611/g.324684  ORF Transcript_100611/g.324684 Transcript_100611/m.324684 type:complete len:200 (+) Transcript_100611:210-809(+)